MFQMKLVEKNRNTYYFQVIWKNEIALDTLTYDNMIRRMRFAGRITKFDSIHSVVSVTILFFNYRKTQQSLQ
jgi:hypothetical protein